MKKLASSLIIGFTVLSFAAPSFAREQTGDAQSHNPGGDVRSICNSGKLEEREQKLLQKQDELKDKMEKNRVEHDQKRLTRRTEQDGKISRRQADRDAKGYKSDEVKAIIDTFRQSIDKAIDAHRASVEAAIAPHRAALDALVAARNAALKAALETFKTTACATTDQAARKTAKNVYKAAVEAARKAFNDGRKAELGNVQGIKESVHTTFRSAMEAAEKVKKDALHALKPLKTTEVR